MKRHFEVAAEALIALVVLLLLWIPAWAQEPTPGQVFVVNKQSASVSLVDIVTMKEVRRILVGAAPVRCGGES